MHEFNSICDVTAENLGAYGLLSSPGYPSSYGSNLDCLVSVVAPAGMAVHVKLQLIDMQLERDCSDAFRARARASGSEFEFCGSFSSTVHRFVNTSAVDLRFVTANHVFAPQNRGFVVRYTSEYLHVHVPLHVPGYVYMYAYSTCNIS